MKNTEFIFQYQDILAKMWNHEPKSRPPFESILSFFDDQINLNEEKSNNTIALDSTENHLNEMIEKYSKINSDLVDKWEVIDQLNKLKKEIVELKNQTRS